MAAKKKSTKSGETGTKVALPRAMTPLPAGIKVARQVILPTLSLKVGEPRYLYIRDAMRTSNYVDPDPKKQKEKPATVCAVADVLDGVEHILLVPSLMESALKEGYPDDTYVSKSFAVEKLPKRPGKRYFDFRLAEIDVSGMNPGS